MHRNSNEENAEIGSRWQSKRTSAYLLLQEHQSHNHYQDIAETH